MFFPFVARLHLVASGRSRESQDQIPDSDFIKISPDPVPTLALTSPAADNFIRQLKFYLGNVIAVSVSDITFDPALNGNVGSMSRHPPCHRSPRDSVTS